MPSMTITITTQQAQRAQDRVAKFDDLIADTDKFSAQISVNLAAAAKIAK